MVRMEERGGEEEVLVLKGRGCETGEGERDLVVVGSDVCAVRVESGRE